MCPTLPIAVHQMKLLFLIFTQHIFESAREWLQIAIPERLVAQVGGMRIPGNVR
jgi:hypothetical protein